MPSEWMDTGLMDKKREPGKALWGNNKIGSGLGINKGSWKIGFATISGGNYRRGSHFVKGCTISARLFRARDQVPPFSWSLDSLDGYPSLFDFAYYRRFEDQEDQVDQDA